MAKSKSPVFLVETDIQQLEDLYVDLVLQHWLQDAAEDARELFLSTKFQKDGLEKVLDELNAFDDLQNTAPVIKGVIFFLIEYLFL